MTKCRAATGRTRLNVFASDPQDEHGTQKHANIQTREREDMGRHGKTWKSYPFGGDYSGFPRCQNEQNIL